jgi:hypothetical protein
MSIQEWAAIGEIVSAIAIVVSLIYVGAQLRQNTRATRVITSQAFVQTHGENVSHLMQEQFRDVYWRGLAGLSNLHGSELAAFGGWTAQLLREFESFYFQWKAGAFEDHIWSGWNCQFRDGSCPGQWCTSREFWFDWTRAQLTTADNRAG